MGLTALPHLCVDSLEILVVSISCGRKGVSRGKFYSYLFVHLKVFLKMFKKMYKISVLALYRLRNFLTSHESTIIFTQHRRRSIALLLRV